MKYRLSARLESFDSSDFRDVFLRQKRIAEPIDLSVGVPEDKTPAHIKAAGIRAIQENNTSYTPTNGLPELRDLIAEKLASTNGIPAISDAVTVVPGLTTGLLLVYMAILDPGDEIIIVDPCYPPYGQLATALGASVMPVLSLPTFHPDIPSIKASITQKTKAIVINSPNNPTGAVYTRKELEEIAEIAREHKIYIISDEIYEHFVYEDKHFSIGSIYPDTITMNGFSKEYAMTGWRLGYIHGPMDVIDAINELQQYMVFSSSSIAQHAAVAALKHPFKNVEKYRKKRDQVVARLKALGYEIHGAQGSYYVFFKAPRDMVDTDFIERAANNNLILVPGRAFSSRHGYVRLSYGAPIDEVMKGIKQLEILTAEIESEPI